MTAAPGELDRIRREYERRDAAAAAGPALAPDPAHLFYVQSLEWAVARMLRRAGVDLAAADVLDVGCGSGTLTNRLAELGARTVTGVDLMEHRIEAARLRFPQLRFQQADAAALPFDDGAFGLVTHFACLSSILDPALRRDVAREMWRVVRPGGAVLSYDLRPAPTPVRWAGRAVVRARAHRGAAAAQTPVRALAPRELATLFPQAELHHRTAILNVELGAVARRSRAAAALLAALPPLRSHVVAVALKREAP